MCVGAARLAGFRSASLISARLREHTSFPAPGQILLYPGGISETEILLAYGAVCFASKVGQLAGNHFLTVVEGQENLTPLGKMTLGRARSRSAFPPLDRLHPDPLPKGEREK